MCELYVLWGWSVRQIAALLGIDRRRDRRMLDDRGHHVPPHGGGRPRRGQRVAPSDSEMSVIRALYVREQRSTARIGEQVGLSAHTVRRVLREAGVRIRTRGGANREDRAQLEAAVIADLYLVRGPQPTRWRVAWAPRGGSCCVSRTTWAGRSGPAGHPRGAALR